MNKICIAFRGLLRPNIVLSEMRARAETAVDSWKARNCWMLWKMVFPKKRTVRFVVSKEAERTLGTFFDRGENGAKVIVDQNHVGGFLGDIGTTTHSDTNISHLEGRGIVY